MSLGIEFLDGKFTFKLFSIFIHRTNVLYYIQRTTETGVKTRREYILEGVFPCVSNIQFTTEDGQSLSTEKTRSSLSVSQTWAQGHYLSGQEDLILPPEVPKRVSFY